MASEQIHFLATHQGVQDWFKHEVEHLGWVLLSHDNAKLQVYRKSLAKLHQTVDSLLENSTQKELRRDLQTIQEKVRNFISLVASISRTRSLAGSEIASSEHALNTAFNDGSSPVVKVAGPEDPLNTGFMTGGRKKSNKSAKKSTKSKSKSKSKKATKSLSRTKKSKSKSKAKTKAKAKSKSKGRK